MAFEIFARAQAKWRGILVYVVLQAAMRFVTALIYAEATSQGLKLYASLAGLATSVYCLTRLWNLLVADEDGDEQWPPIWS